MDGKDLGSPRGFLGGLMPSLPPPHHGWRSNEPCQPRSAIRTERPSQGDGRTVGRRAADVVGDRGAVQSAPRAAGVGSRAHPASAATCQTLPDQANQRAGTEADRAKGAFPCWVQLQACSAVGSLRTHRPGSCAAELIEHQLAHIASIALRPATTTWWRQSNASSRRGFHDQVVKAAGSPPEAARSMSMT